MPAFFGLPPADPGFELFVATTGMSQGIAQTDGVQLRPRIVLTVGNAQLGAQWRNVDSPAANGVGIFSVKYGRAVGKVRLEGVAAYRVRTGARPSFDKSAWEFTGTARRRFDGWALHAELQYSPDEFGTGTSLYAESGIALDIARSTTLSLNVARRERERAPDYSSMSFGISTAVGKRVIVDARLFATDRSRLGPAYRSRIVVSARLTL